MCWCCKKEKDLDTGQPKGAKKGDSKGKGKKEFKFKCFKCGKIGHMSKECRSNETKRVHSKLATSIEMAMIGLSALEMGEEVQLPEEDHRIRIGIDSCAAVTVFPKTVADGCHFCQIWVRERCRSNPKTGLFGT